MDHTDNDNNSGNFRNNDGETHDSIPNNDNSDNTNADNVNSNSNSNTLKINNEKITMKDYMNFIQNKKTDNNNDTNMWFTFL